MLGLIPRLKLWVCAQKGFVSVICLVLFWTIRRRLLYMGKGAPLLVRPDVVVILIVIAASQLEGGCRKCLGKGKNDKIRRIPRRCEDDENLVIGKMLEAVAAIAIPCIPLGMPVQAAPVIGTGNVIFREILVDALSFLEMLLSKLELQAGFVFGCGKKTLSMKQFEILGTKIGVFTSFVGIFQASLQAVVPQSVGHKIVKRDILQSLGQWKDAFEVEFLKLGSISIFYGR